MGSSKNKVSVKDRVSKSLKKSKKTDKKEKPIEKQEETIEEQELSETEESKEKEQSSSDEESEEEKEEVQEENEQQKDDSHENYTSEEQRLLSVDEEMLEDTNFDGLDLDSRLVQALTLMKLYKPTPIQAKAIPLALGLKKDIIGRAKTGSGKTVAYAIPIVESILQESVQKLGSNNTGSSSSHIGNRAIILVPSRELANQVTKLFESLSIFADKIVGVVNVSQQASGSAGGAKGDVIIDSILATTKPAIIVGTPARVVSHLQSGSIDCSAISYLVIDEADLINSYGFQEDLDTLASLLPVKKTIQTWLMSATLSEEINEMKEKFCRKNLATLKLEDDGKDNSQNNQNNKLLQYYAKCSEIDKFLLAYVIFKLNLIRGKTLIFVNTTERCYQLKLFFEQFGIKSTVLNSELPVASRLHIVDEFNRDVYNLLIATDENTHYTKADEQEEEEAAENEKGEENSEKSKESSKGKKKFKKDQEYSVSRGVDFKNVSCVLNFDFPTSSTTYTHRVGRTARADKSGMSLSFVVPRKEYKKHRSCSVETTKRDEKILSRIISHQEKKIRKIQALNEDGPSITELSSDPSMMIQPYIFDMKQVEAFRYRMEDAFRAVTKIAVREARLKEIKSELLASEKLKRHFEENPEDLVQLRHDKELHSATVQPHMKRIPQYLIPTAARKSLTPIGGPGMATYAGIKKPQSNRQKKFQKKMNNNRRKSGGKNPLKTFGK